MDSKFLKAILFSITVVAVAISFVVILSDKSSDEAIDISIPARISNVETYMDSERFITVSCSESKTHIEYILVDKETGVEYLYIVSKQYQGCAITPLYTVSGTLMRADNNFN